MSKKPNISAIEIYAEKVADTICDDFFSGHDYITGIQITKLSTIQSVNLFILKRIFENWQKEAIRIQSPYFDYSTEVVRTSLGHLMNALSKNINISRLHFLPLLQKAIRDVLVLTFAPEIFYEEFFGMQGIKIPMKNYLIPMFGYIKIHPRLATEILSSLEEEAGVNIKRIEAVNIANNIIRDHKELQEDPKDIIALFNEIVPVGIFELHPNYLDESPAENTSDSFVAKDVDAINIEQLSEDVVSFDFESDTTEEKPIEEVSELSQEESPKELDDLGFETIVIEEPDYAAISDNREKEDVVEDSSESLIEEEKVPSDENGNVEEVEFDTSVSEDLTESTEELEEVPQTIQDTIKSENNTEEEGATLLDKIQGNSSNTSESIRASMSINQKFLFQKELFGGDAEIMEDAIKQIDNSADYTEAINLIKVHYAQQYDWDFTSEAVMNFISLVDMKF